MLIPARYDRVNARFMAFPCECASAASGTLLQRAVLDRPACRRNEEWTAVQGEYLREGSTKKPAPE
jgi:hypothetical protein